MEIPPLLNYEVGHITLVAHCFTSDKSVEVVENVVLTEICSVPNRKENYNRSSKMKSHGLPGCARADGHLFIL